VGVQQSSDENQIGESPSDRDDRQLEVEFDGETVPFHNLGAFETDGADGALLVGNVPYTVESTRLYVPVTVAMNLDGGGESIPEDCRTSIEAVTRQVAESVRPDEASTFEQRIENERNDPP
jgi:hypothetical protein